MSTGWWCLVDHDYLFPITPFESMMPLPSHIAPPATTAPAKISPINLIYLISVFMPFNCLLYSQNPELLLEVEVVKWGVFCPRSLFGLIDDAFLLIQSTLNGWCSIRHRNTSSIGHVKGYNCAEVRCILTCRVGFLLFHAQKLLPLVLGSDPLIPQDPAERWLLDTQLCLGLMCTSCLS